MKNKRKVSMIAMSAILCGMLAFSAYAASASATSTEAHASVSVSGRSQVLAAIARMGNSSDWTGDSLEDICTSLSADAYASNLPGGYAQVSRASAWIGDECVAEDYWTE